MRPSFCTSNGSPGKGTAIRLLVNYIGMVLWTLLMFTFSTVSNIVLVCASYHYCRRLLGMVWDLQRSRQGSVIKPPCFEGENSRYHLIYNEFYILWWFQACFMVKLTEEQCMYICTFVQMSCHVCGIKQELIAHTLKTSS